MQLQCVHCSHFLNGIVYTELLHIANEMYDICSVYSARQFAGRHI